MPQKKKEIRMITAGISMIKWGLKMEVNNDFGGRKYNYLFW